MRVDSRHPHGNIRSAILVDGGLHADPSRQEMGRTLAKDLPALGLRRGDRLEPSSELRDTSKFESRSLPFRCTFWRQHRDNRGRLSTFTLRRNPLFCKELGTSPTTTLHLDSLHTVYLGIFMFYVHAVIMAMWRANVFQCHGPEKAKQVANLDIFFSLYKTWCNTNQVSLNYQLNQVTHSMVGPPSQPGLKTKAAETGIFMFFVFSSVANTKGSSTTMRVAHSWLQGRPCNPTWISSVLRLSVFQCQTVGSFCFCAYAF